MKNFTDPSDKSINKQYNVVQQYNAFIYIYIKSTYKDGRFLHTKHLQ